jgi:hypothetical protein
MEKINSKEDAYVYVLEQQKEMLSKRVEDLETQIEQYNAQLKAMNPAPDVIPAREVIPAPGRGCIRYNLKNGCLHIHPNTIFNMNNKNTDPEVRSIPVRYHRDASVMKAVLDTVKDLFIHPNGVHDPNAFNMVMLYLASTLHEQDTNVYLNLIGDGTSGVGTLIDLYVCMLNNWGALENVHKTSLIEGHPVWTPRALAFYAYEHGDVNSKADVTHCVSRPHIFLSNTEVDFVQGTAKHVIKIHIIRKYRGKADPNDPCVARANIIVSQSVLRPDWKEAFLAILVDFYERFRDEFGCDIHAVIARYHTQSA